MILNLHNTGIEPILVEYCNERTLINPGEIQHLISNSINIKLKIYHQNSDKLNSFWYLLNDIFTLEQMRTILVVDGEYEVVCNQDNNTLKIKSYEYIFEKNTSYHTFVFFADGCDVIRKKLVVSNDKRILKKARFLYLFGGQKTLLPLTGIAFIVSFIRCLIISIVPTWLVIMTLGLLGCFLLYFFRYVLSLNNLKRAMKSESVLAYLSSERKEFRKLTDELVQQYFNTEKEHYI